MIGGPGEMVLSGRFLVEPRAAPVSERDKRHGQAVAAASLPTIPPFRSADVHTGVARGDTAGAPVAGSPPHGLPEREGVGER